MLQQITHQRTLVHGHVLRKWSQTRQLKFKELCEVEYLETIGDGDYMESSSEGEVLSLGDDDSSGI